MILTKYIKLMTLICALIFLMLAITSCKTKNNILNLKANDSSTNILPVSSNKSTPNPLVNSAVKSSDEAQITETPINSSTENVITIKSTNNITPTPMPITPTATPYPYQQTNPMNFITAKLNNPTIDGVINNDEYAATYIMDVSNSSSWTPTIGTCPTVNFYFAWSDKGLYIAVKSANIVQLKNFMINLNPNNLIVAGGAGVFFSFNFNDNGTIQVLRHNYQTVNVTTNNDGKPSGFNISSKVTLKVVESNGISLELLIPIAELQVKSVSRQLYPNIIDATALTIRENDVWGIGTYMVFSDFTAWSSLLGKDIPYEELSSYIFKIENLGKITFLS